jgi:predicted glycoside hydrolase/deacetylase ChbG (UPF0249 family)
LSPATITSKAIATNSEEQSASPEEESPRAGCLIVNADDWGRDRETTDRTLDCIWRGSVSSVSAMVFMEDSERAAALAKEHGVDAGLHLNLTSPFTETGINPRLREKQQRLRGILRASRFSPAMYYPWLASAFEYVVRAQVDEFERLYGKRPQRIDGHHHMHLCANVQTQRLLPEGTIARRNFSFAAGESSVLNRLYRSIQDRRLQRRHRTTDYFFSIKPLESGRLAKILDLGRHHKVEMETHPVNADEFSFLIEGGMQALLKDIRVAKRYDL